MKASTFLAIVCLIGLAQRAFSLECYLCASKAECENPEIETCPNEKDSCMVGKVEDQEVVKGCVPFDFDAKTREEFFYNSAQPSDYGLNDKLDSVLEQDDNMLESISFCRNRNFCNI